MLQEMPEGEVHSPPGVLRELEDHGDNRIAYLSEIITIMEPSKDALSKVDRGARETGDDARLSPVDREVIALAIDLDATLMSDDYSLQNLATHLGVPYSPAGMKGITRQVRWRYRCVGCGRVWSKNHPDCPVCGSPLRSFRSKK